MKSKTTPLHAWHLRQGANMAEFGGYQMPLWYTSAKNEHLAVINAAGLFDTSHMATVLVQGPDALDLLQFCFTQNLTACIGPRKEPISPGRCVYGAYLNEQGHVIDDSIINQIAPECYMLVVNAGMGAVVAAHVQEQGRGRRVTVTDCTDQIGKMDVQGPLAARILRPLLADPEVLAAMPYFTFKGNFQTDTGSSDAVRLTDGTPVLLSRTGYTGEFGFELFVALEKTVAVWEMLLAAGKDFGLQACGLAARDSLRAGAVLPLSHQDIGHWPFIDHPWPFALPFTAAGDRFSKDFLGAAALLAARGQSFTLPFAGFDLRKVSLPAQVLSLDGEEIGQVLTCVTDMAIARVDGRICSAASPDRPDGFQPRGLCCGFVRIAKQLAPETRLHLADGRRQLEVEIVRDIRPARTARRPIREML